MKVSMCGLEPLEMFSTHFREMLLEGWRLEFSLVLEMAPLGAEGDPALH